MRAAAVPSNHRSCIDLRMLCGQSSRGFLLVSPGLQLSIDSDCFGHYRSSERLTNMQIDLSSLLSNSVNLASCSFGSIFQLALCSMRLNHETLLSVFVHTICCSLCSPMPVWGSTLSPGSSTAHYASSCRPRSARAARPESLSNLRRSESLLHVA